MAIIDRRIPSHLGRSLLTALIAAAFLCVSTIEASETETLRVGQAVLKKLPRAKPHSVPRLPVPNIALVTRRSLSGSGNVQWNINALLQQAVEEGRIGDIEKLAFQQRYSAIPGRGDFALLECLKVRTCDLRKFPDLAAEVGLNQLHLQHAARCVSCNKVNIFKLSGNTAEKLMDSFYKQGGWTKLKGEIGISGIDGLYYKPGASGGVADVLVTEAKFNVSVLQETKSGTQLSKQWILDNLARLQHRAYRENNHELGDLYVQIDQLVERDAYRAQLWRMNVDDDRLFIWRESVSSKGKTVSRAPIQGMPPWNPGSMHVIDMLKPGSNFDRQILSNYQDILSQAADHAQR